jgi:hypothetical protein
MQPDERHKAQSNFILIRLPRMCILQSARHPLPLDLRSQLRVIFARQLLVAARKQPVPQIDQDPRNDGLSRQYAK